jgi:hypothetical protein
VKEIIWIARDFSGDFLVLGGIAQRDFLGTD